MSAFFSIQCVETLITVRVFPDGRYFMQFRSEGDEKDVFDDDFKLPMSSPWTSDIIQRGKPDSDETVHIINTQAILNGSTTFHPANEGPAPQRHPINIVKQDGIFSTVYSLQKIFQGRRVHQKYPLLAQSMADVGTDSTDKVVETEIIMYCLKMGMDDLEGVNELKSLLKERILNHFRGVFYKAEEEGNLFGLLTNSPSDNQDTFILPGELIRTNFIPFESVLPPNFDEKCMQAMIPYINEANITVKLHDDTFKFAGILPGAITQSNADSISNDTLWWSFGSEEFINDDYVIEAASIIYHPKRIQLSIVLGALIMILSLIFISKKRKIR